MRKAFLGMWLAGPYGCLWLVALQAAPLPALLGPLVKLGMGLSMILGAWIWAWPVWVILLVARPKLRSTCVAALAGGVLSLLTIPQPIAQRHKWIDSLAAQGDRLAARIEEERRLLGFYPVELTEAKLATGAAGYDHFRYALDRDHGFELGLSTPSGGINFDRMFYWPRRGYPESLHGEPLEKIGNWAYLHE